MKLIRHGMVFLVSLYFFIICLVGCAHFHQVVFINEACIKPFHRYNYRTCDVMRVKIDDKKYNIPKNFETDLASVPRLLWPVIAPQYSGFVAPAILHDFLYRCDHSLSREYADEVLYSALITEDVTAFTAAKFYVAVRLFGGKAYDQHNGVC